MNVYIAPMCVSTLVCMSRTPTHNILHSTIHSSAIKIKMLKAVGRPEPYPDTISLLQPAMPMEDEDKDVEVCSVLARF
jgi:hypothetical protein